MTRSKSPPPLWATVCCSLGPLFPPRLLIFRLQWPRLMSSEGVNSYQSFPVNACRQAPHSRLDMSWWIVRVVLQFSLTRRVDTTHKTGGGVIWRTQIDDDQSQCSTILRHSPNPPLFSIFSLSLSRRRSWWGVEDRTRRRGWKVPPNTRQCYEDRLCFVGRALKRYEASHIDYTQTYTNRRVNVVHLGQMKASSFTICLQGERECLLIIVEGMK